MRDAPLVELLHEAAAAVARVLDGVTDWGPAGTRTGDAGHTRYHPDLAADRAAVGVLVRAGVTVVSEESGVHQGGGGDAVTVVVDPLDGSTNASLGIPWYAASLCAVDPDGPRAAVVLDLPRNVAYEAVRGHGATRDGAPIRPSACRTLGDAVIGLSALPDRHWGWRQVRALGAASLDLCAVAAGMLDAYADCGVDAHGPWDYLGGVLVCREAGAVVADAHDRSLDGTGHDVRRTPLAAATPELLGELRAARRA